MSTKTPLQLVQLAELDVANFLHNPNVYDVVEYFQGVQMALLDAISMLGGTAIETSSDTEQAN